MWGATGDFAYPRHQSRISIHAPRVGRDYSVIKRDAVLWLFQSTRPVWGATVDHILRVRFSGISIHAPRVGRDAGGWRICGLHSISIHAPRVGRDLSQLINNAVKVSFQSTRPVWGATAPCKVPMRNGRYFNPRAPCGARLQGDTGKDIIEAFQSTRPVWGATYRGANRGNGRGISIHAPRVGRDCYRHTDCAD